jgi:omega-6 fatty acid desaturase (delta-12 desaturase)
MFENISSKIWREAIAPYQKPILSRSVWQLVNSFVPYFILWGLMIWSLSVSYWLTLALMVVAAGFVTRIFIIFHDCGHGAFFKSQRAAAIVGFVAGVLTFTPYEQWRRNHAIHHATAGDLDRRGIGDIYTMTVDEYLSAPWIKRLGYRLLRNPLVILGLAPLWVFIIAPRFAKRSDGVREKWSVVWTNLALLAIFSVASLTIGWKAYVMIQLPLMWGVGAVGIWLFYVQHQFPGVYWARHEQWDYFKSAVQGASFYKLPKLLQWFTGNIGFHHIHHLGPRIPNYLLESCQKNVALFQNVRPLSLWASFKCLSLRLWDEQSQQLITFKMLRQMQLAKARA